MSHPLESPPLGERVGTVFLWTHVDITNFSHCTLFLLLFLDFGHWFVQCNHFFSSVTFLPVSGPQSDVQLRVPLLSFCALLFSSFFFSFSSIIV